MSARVIASWQGRRDVAVWPGCLCCLGPTAAIPASRKMAPIVFRFAEERSSPLHQHQHEVKVRFAFLLDCVPLQMPHSRSTDNRAKRRVLRLNSKEMQHETEEAMVVQI